MLATTYDKLVEAWFLEQQISQFYKLPLLITDIGIGVPWVSLRAKGKRRYWTCQALSESLEDPRISCSAVASYR